MTRVMPGLGHPDQVGVVLSGIAGSSPAMTKTVAAHSKTAPRMRGRFVCRALSGSGGL